MKTYSLPCSIDGLLFDIDNTLYRNDEYYQLQTDLLVARYAKEKEIEEGTAHELVAAEKSRYKKANRGHATSLGNVMLRLGIPISVNASWRDELFHPEHHLSADRGVVDALAVLVSHFKIAAVTNNTLKVAKRTLRALGLQDFFAVIVGLDTCFVSKPDADPFLTAVRLLGTSIPNTVTIGDRYGVDIKTPLTLGMGGILVENLGDLLCLPDTLGVGD